MLPPVCLYSFTTELPGTLPCCPCREMPRERWASNAGLRLREAAAKAEEDKLARQTLSRQRVRLLLLFLSKQMDTAQLPPRSL